MERNLILSELVAHSVSFQVSRQSLNGSMTVFRPEPAGRADPVSLFTTSFETIVTFLRNHLKSKGFLFFSHFDPKVRMCVQRH